MNHLFENVTSPGQSITELTTNHLRQVDNYPNFSRPTLKDGIISFICKSLLTAAETRLLPHVRCPAEPVEGRFIH
jgi:hypothetical protein